MSSTDAFRCEPPFHADPGQENEPLMGRKLYLVCGRNVKKPGYYISWPSADLQYKHVSGATLKGYYDFSDLRAAWHARCDLGEHDHPRRQQHDHPRRQQGGAPLPPSPPSPPLRIVYISDSPSPSPSPPLPSRSPSPSPDPSPAPPAYSTLPLLSVNAGRPVASARVQSDRDAVPLSGLMCYAVRAEGQGEVFSDLQQVCARFRHLHATGKGPAFVMSPSLTRCIAWISEISPPGSVVAGAVDDEERLWAEEEEAAYRRRVLMDADFEV
ncbi:hypothetical protein DFH06DRAFT_1321617 [Mycena polygramma]|nr:hypothetical protein DFH06DRAFT_1321617 [Mycena polygramma]